MPFRSAFRCEKRNLKKRLAENAKLQLRFEQANRNREFHRHAQQLARECSELVVLHSSLKAVRRCLLVGYRGKWRSILVFLIAKVWLAKSKRRQHTFEKLKVNCILRRYLPKAVGRIRESRRAGQIVAVRDFLRLVSIATHFSRVLHKFSTRVRRAQRIVKRRLLAKKLRQFAIEFAIHQQLSLDREEKLMPTPKRLWTEVARRLCLLDMETFHFERRRTLEQFIMQVQEVDRSETLKFEGYVHTQSIVAQSALVTILRCRSLVLGTGLLELAHSIDRGRPVSVEDKERLIKWFVELYFNVSRRLSASSLSQWEEVRQTRVSPTANLLRDEDTMVVLYQIVHSRSEQLRRSVFHLGATLTHPASLSRVGSLTTMAESCNSLTLPFFVENDLVNVVLNQVAKPARGRRKSLLKPEAVKLLMKGAKDAWFNAWKKVAQRIGHENIHQISSTTRLGSFEERLTLDKSVIESLSQSYSKMTSEPAVITEVLLNMDFSFLDSFYRRGRAL